MEAPLNWPRFRAWWEGVIVGYGLVVLSLLLSSTFAIFRGDHDASSLNKEGPPCR